MALRRNKFQWVDFCVVQSYSYIASLERLWCVWRIGLRSCGVFYHSVSKKLAVHKVDRKYVLIINVHAGNKLIYLLLISRRLCQDAYLCCIDMTWQWRNNGHNSVSNHQLRDCLLHRLFRRKSKETSKLRVAGLCEGNSPMTGEFPAQRISYAENVYFRWRHHENPQPFKWRSRARLPLSNFTIGHQKYIHIPIFKL